MKNSYKFYIPIRSKFLCTSDFSRVTGSTSRLHSVLIFQRPTRTLQTVYQQKMETVYRIHRILRFHHIHHGFDLNSSGDLLQDVANGSCSKPARIQRGDQCATASAKHEEFIKPVKAQKNTEMMQKFAKGLQIIHQNIGVELPGKGKEPKRCFFCPTHTTEKQNQTLSAMCLCLWGRGITNLA